MCKPSSTLWVRLGLLGLTLGIATAPANASEDEVIRAFLQALKNDTLRPGERARLAAELGTYGEKAAPAVPALIEALTDKITVRQMAADALAAIGAPAVPALVAGLDNDDPEVVIIHLAVLRDMGPRANAAVPRLVKTLCADHPKVRVAVAETLGFIQEPDSIPALAERVRDDPDFGVKRSAAYALQGFGPKAKEAVPPLINALRIANTWPKRKPPPQVQDSGLPPRSNFLNSSTDPFLNLSLATGSALAAIGQDAVPALVELLGDADKDLRLEALFTLAEMGREAKAAVPVIAKRLTDKEVEVREYAALALEDIGPDAVAAMPALRKAFSDPAPRVRIKAAHAALEIVPNAEGALGVVLEGLRHKEASVRLFAIQELRSLHLITRVVCEALATATKDTDETIREWAVEGLEEMGGPAEIVLPALEAALTDRSEGVRLKAAGALSEVPGGEKAVMALIRAVRDSDAHVRAEAVRGLGKYAQQAVCAIPALEQALQDPAKHVREEAANALKQIKERKK